MQVVENGGGHLTGFDHIDNYSADKLFVIAFWGLCRSCGRSDRYGRSRRGGNRSRQIVFGNRRKVKGAHKQIVVVIEQADVVF